MALSSSSVLSGSIEGEINTFDEPTQISEISDKNFRVTLHKTYINNALYRVQGSDEEDRYESHIHANHFDGQECKDLIQGYPAIIEKLFKSERCNISITDSSMICEFRDVIIPVRITLSKIAETLIEKMDKTIRKQERKIVALGDENKQLNIITGNMTNQIKTLEMLLNEISERLKKVESRSPPIYPRKLKMLEESVKNLESKLDGSENKYPANILGIWKWCHGTIDIEKYGEIFSITMKHEYGESDCSVIDPRWIRGKFFWNSQYQGQSCHVVSNEMMNFCYDLQQPNVIIETCGQHTNKFEKIMNPPSNLAGKWIFNSNTIYHMTITCNGNSFIVERSHLGNKIFHPSNMGWKNGVFYWDIPKIHNHTTDVHYAFDPKDPKIILEINGDVQNIFKKE